MSKPLPAAVRTHFTALRMLLVMTAVLGLAYPLLVTGVSQLAFAAKANGSIVKSEGREVGSSLIGQNFNLPGSDRPDPKWFQPRFSAGSYDPKASGASNLGPNSEVLLQAVQERRAAIAAFDGVTPASVPADAVTASGSGLDPDISVAYAEQQVNRVAGERKLSTGRVAELVKDHTTGRTLGFLGDPHVNVVELNKALGELT